MTHVQSDSPSEAPVVQLHRFAHVQMALRSAQLLAPGESPAEQGHPHRGAGDVHDLVHQAVRETFSPAALTAALPLLAHDLEALLEHSAVSDRCAVHEITQPWAELAASRLLPLTPQELQTVLPLAREIFHAAARSHDGHTTPLAQRAALALLEACQAPHAGTVQSVVAITQSVPALLASALYALLTNASEYAWLRANAHDDASLVRATHELLRYATPTRTVYRVAAHDTTIGDIRIPSGAIVALSLARANRDTDEFAHGNTLSLADGRSGSLTFGAGDHACSGASVVRALLECFVTALARSGVMLRLADATQSEWLDGAAIRVPLRMAVQGIRG